MQSDWCFSTKHVRGIANILVDCVLRLDRLTIASVLHVLRLDIAWKGQRLWQTAADLCTDILDDRE